MSALKVTISLLAGMAAGATLGILFAPQAGTETRDELSESLSNISDSIKENAFDQFNNLLDNFKTKILDAVKSIFGTELPKEDPADDLEHA